MPVRFVLLVCAAALVLVAIALTLDEAANESSSPSQPGASEATTVAAALHADDRPRRAAVANSTGATVSTEVMVEDDLATADEVPASRQSELRVRVVDSTGASLVGASVVRRAGTSLSWQRGEQPRIERRLPCDAQGLATIVRAREHCSVQGEAEGYVAAAALDWDPEAGRSDGFVPLPVVPREPWRVRVVDAAGRPVAGATIRARVADASPLPASPHASVAYGPPLPIAVVTGNEGDGVMSLARGRAYEIEVLHADFAVFAAALPADARPAEIVLDRGTEIEVCVVDDKGQPVAGAQATTRGEREATVTADARGHLTLRGVTVGGSVDVVFTASGHARRLRTLVPPTNDSVPTSVVLARSQSIDGELRDERDQPIGGAMVILRPHHELDADTPETRCILQATSDFAGGFRVEDAAPGEYAVEIVRPGASRAEFVAIVEAGWSGVTLRADGWASASIEGEIRGLSAEVLARGVVVSIGRARGEIVVSEDVVVRDPHGLFRVDGLEPGLVSLAVYGDKRFVVAKKVELMRGRNAVQIGS